MSYKPVTVPCRACSKQCYNWEILYPGAGFTGFCASCVNDINDGISEYNNFPYTAVSVILHPLSKGDNACLLDKQPAELLNIINKQIAKFVMTSDTSVEPKKVIITEAPCKICNEMNDLNNPKITKCWHCENKL